MIEQMDVTSVDVASPLELPDLPTDVGMPGHTIEVEVGGHVCLNSGIIFAALR